MKQVIKGDYVDKNDKMAQNQAYYLVAGRRDKPAKTEELAEEERKKTKVS